MTDLELIEQCPFLLGPLVDCRKGDAAQQRIKEMSIVRMARPISDSLRMKAEYAFYLSRPCGFHITRREFERKYANGAPSYLGIS